MRGQRGFSLMGFPPSLKAIGSRCQARQSRQGARIPTEFTSRSRERTDDTRLSRSSIMIPTTQRIRD